MYEKDKQFDELFAKVEAFLEDKELQEDEQFIHDVKFTFLNLDASEQADLISQIKPKKRKKFIDVVANDIDADILSHLEKAVLIDFVEVIGNETFARMLSLLSINDEIDVLEEFPKEFRKEILEFIQYKKRIKIKRLLSYPQESVGRNMSMDFLSVPVYFTVKETMEYLHKNVKVNEKNIKNTEIFVLNEEEKIVGSISVFQLIRLKQADLIKDKLSPVKYILNTYEETSEAIEKFIEHNLQIMPVLDVNSKFVGVLEINNVLNLIQEESEKNLLMPAGVFEATQEGIFGRAKARFVWLFVNLITASIAASVVSVFEPLVAMFAVLASLMPIVASIGGNTGNQASAVIIRSLATKEFSSKLVLTEVLTSFVNSLFFAVFSFGATYLIHGNLNLSISFGLAILINLNIGSLFGSFVPLVVSKFKIDPAFCSSIFVTMITDTSGFFCFLGIAYFLLGS